MKVDWNSQSKFTLPISKLYLYFKIYRNDARTISNFPSDPTYEQPIWWQTPFCIFRISAGEKQKSLLERHEIVICIRNSKIDYAVLLPNYVISCPSSLFFSTDKYLCRKCNARAGSKYDAEWWILIMPRSLQMVLSDRVTKTYRADATLWHPKTVWRQLDSDSHAFIKCVIGRFDASFSRPSCQWSAKVVENVRFSRSSIV